VKRSIALLAALGLVLVPAGARATMVRALTLAELVGHAERVVVGRCLDAHETTDPRTGLPITEVTLAVTETLKGPAESRLVFRQLGDRRRPGPAPSFAVGEDVLLFLGRESASGLTAPVGFEQGRVPITRPAGVAPMATVTETAVRALEPHTRCLRPGRCRVELEGLLGAIRGMVAP
jgi:hypothetical protein